MAAAILGSASTLPEAASKEGVRTPAELAEQLAGELPELLAERLDDQVSWQIRTVCERFDLGDEDRILEVAHQSRRGKGGIWWSA